MEVGAPGVMEFDVDYDYRDDGYVAASLQVAGVNTQGLQGNLSWGADGSFDFSPFSGYNGWTSYEYTLTDGLSVSAPARVHIYVPPYGEDTGEDDPPGGGPPDPFYALNDLYFYDQSDISGNVSANDEGLSKFILTGAPDHGRLIPETAEGFTLGGSFTYRPDPIYSGPVNGVIRTAGGTQGMPFVSYTGYSDIFQSAGAVITLVKQQGPVAVQSVQITKWDKQESGLDHNPNYDKAGKTILQDHDATGATPGGGEKIFPDRETPTDEFAYARRTVQVVVTLNQPRAGVPILIVAQDVDDPSSNAPPVDNENDVQDNRFGGVAWMTPANQIITDAKGAARAEMYIDGIQPGNNFRVFAETDFSVELAAGGKQDDGTNARMMFVDGTVIENDDPRVSPLLTVWRRLHVERDRMGPPPASDTAFGGATDDPRPTGPLPDPSIALMLGNYRPAYIEVADDDVAALNTQRVMDFVHNLEGGTGYDAGSAVRDVATASNFWVSHMIGAYEGPAAMDGDPDYPADFIGGVTAGRFSGPPPVLVGAVSFVFLECQRDLAASDPPGIVPETTLIERAVLHESAHHFLGLFDHSVPEDPVTNPADQGPMSWSTNFFGSDEENRFTPAQLALLRSDPWPK